MTFQDRKLAFSIYLYLGALFITSLVVSNLIFQKFFQWQPLGNITILGAPLFELSVGILPYPLTFLITDLISEIYGKKKANQIVTAGIFASVFSMGILWIANKTQAMPASPVNNTTFANVFAFITNCRFSLNARLPICSIYRHFNLHFWKRVTKGKHLWLRNNFSTFSSQFIDTFTVVSLLCIFKVLPWNLFYGLVVSGFLFKVMIAMLDTPLLYAVVFILRKKFGLKPGEEIVL